MTTVIQYDMISVVICDCSHNQDIPLCHLLSRIQSSQIIELLYTGNIFRIGSHHFLSPLNLCRVAALVCFSDVISDGNFERGGGGRGRGEATKVAQGNPEVFQDFGALRHSLRSCLCGSDCNGLGWLELSERD